MYAAFLILDSVNKNNMASNCIKFVSIFCCLLFVLISYIKYKEKNILLMLIILCFTVIADIFLLFTNRFEIGIFSFIIVQILYSLKIKCMCKDNCKKYMIEVLGVTFIWNIIILILKNKECLTPTIVLASSYFIIFTINLIKSSFAMIKNKRRTMYEISFVIGLFLFYLCDINVGLNNLSSMQFEIPLVIGILVKCSGILMWFFYLPAQVILSINAVLYDRTRNKSKDYSTPYA